MTTPRQPISLRLDRRSMRWFVALLNNAKKAKKTLAIPVKQFDLLKVWGFVDGTPDNPKLGSNRPPQEWIDKIELERTVSKKTKEAKCPENTQNPSASQPTLFGFCNGCESETRAYTRTRATGKWLATSSTFTTRSISFSAQPPCKPCGTLIMYRRPHEDEPGGSSN